MSDEVTGPRALQAVSAGIAGWALLHLYSPIGWAWLALAAVLATVGWGWDRTRDRETR